MHRAASEARRQAKALKSLMFGLTAAGGDSGARAADAMRTAREAVFVITDMEASTAQAAASAAGASSVQAIYDTARALAVPRVACRGAGMAELSMTSACALAQMHLRV